MAPRVLIMYLISAFLMAAWTLCPCILMYATQVVETHWGNWETLSRQGGANVMRSLEVPTICLIIILACMGGTTNVFADSVTITPASAEGEFTGFARELNEALNMSSAAGNHTVSGLTVLQELKLGALLEACHDTSCVQEIKQQVSTDWLVHPSIAAQGDGIAVSLTLWDLKGQKPTQQETVFSAANPRARKRAFLNLGQKLQAALSHPHNSQKETNLEVKTTVKRRRLVLMLKETTDGKPQSVQIAEGKVTQALIQDGHKLVAGEVAQKLKSSQAFALAIQGQLPGELSAIDADFLIVGHVDSAYFNEIKDVQLVAYRANIEMKLVRLGTGQILASLQMEGKGNGFSKAKAARKALAHAADQVIPALQQALADAANAPDDVELVVHGIPNFRRGSDLQQSLEELLGADNIRVLHQSNQLTKYELTTSVKSAQLSRNLDGTPLMPLEIVQVTAGQILARYSATRAVQLSTVVMQPIIKIGSQSDWLATNLPELIESELSNFDFLSVESLESARPAFGRGKIRSADIIKASKNFGSAPLVVVPLLYRTSKRAGAPLVFDLKVYHGPTGALLLGTTASGILSEVAAVVSKASEKLAKNFLPKILKNRSLKKLLPPAKEFKSAQTTTLVAAKLKLSSIELEPIYPAQMLRYQRFSSGSLTLQHSSKKGPPATGVTVSVFIPALMEMPSQIAYGDMTPGESVRIALPLVLDAKRLTDRESSAATQARFEITYAINGASQSLSRTVPVMVHGARTIDWINNQAAAAFVTPRESSVLAIAEAVADGVVDDSSAFRNAVAVLEALKQIGFRYAKDPNGVTGNDSLDEIQFPRETLRSQTGDCDDLTVLYAAALEALGIETAFLYVPGHILLAFNSQFDTNSAHRLGVGSFTHGGKLWVPVEATAIPDGFLVAQKRGMQEVKRWEKSRGFTVQPIHDAWRQHPPMALLKDRVAVQIDRPKLKGAVEMVLRTAEKNRRQTLSAVVKRLGNKANKKRATLDAVHAYGLALVRAEDYKKAKEVFQRATKREPSNHVVLVNSTSLRLLAGENIDLAAYAQSIEALDEGALYNNLGLAYFQVGDLEQAGKAFVEAARRGNTRLANKLGLSGSHERAAGGKGEGAVLQRDLQSVMMRAFGRAKKRSQLKQGNKRSRFTQALRTAGKRGTPPDVQRKLVDLLAWPVL